MKRALVSGGAGFIGSWLCEELLNNGFSVLCVDNLCTGREKNISHLKDNKNFEFLMHDITKPIENINDIDFIFHLASPASPPDYQKLAIETLMVNSLGTLNLLESARKNKSRFLLASTSEVYGDPLENPQKESYWGNVNPNGERSMYDEAKRFSEALVMSYKRKYDEDVRIVRIFNTYGPRMRKEDGRVVSNFINQALQDKSLTVYGDGKQTRSFCYVSDMVSGLMKMMFTNDLNGQVINLGNPNEKKVAEIAEIIKMMTGSNSEIVFKDLPKDDPKQRCPDISKAEKLLGWQPKITLEEGLKKIVDWYRKEK